MFMKPSFVSRLFSHVSQQSHEATAWLKRYARNPRNVGSILPSSKMLGRAMTSAALRYGARDALFIEAGAGNGAITRVLAQSLAGRNRLVACEFLPSFAQELQRRLPEIEVACCRVQDLPHWQEAGNKTIVSSLPFRSLAKDEARDIGRRVFAKRVAQKPALGVGAVYLRAEKPDSVIGGGRGG